MKETEKKRELKYYTLKRLLPWDRFSDALDVENTRLHAQVRSLTELAEPTQLNEFDARWINFYVPLRFRGKASCIPMSVMDYKGDYHLRFESLERLRRVRLSRGDAEINPIYYQIITAAAEFVPRLSDLGELEKLVPLDFRSGKVPGKLGFELPDYPVPLPLSEIPREIRSRIVWDKLEVVKPRILPQKRA